MSFPASLMGERIQGRDSKEQAKRRDSSNSPRLYSLARGPFTSVNKRCRKGGKEG